MCCFSRPVQSVTATRIFAKFTGPGRQAVVYQMRLDAPEDLAMILPIPVVRPAPDDAVRFVNLEGYKELFQDLEKGFPQPKSRDRSGALSLPTDEARLPVHSVGAFDASFVPGTDSFGRLDERFRLPGEVWAQLPQYARFGFAVFKLKQGRSDVHPMAFTFPSTLRDTLFFPTVHIHDGKVHAKEEFDHILYAQPGPNALIPGWTESPQTAGAFVNIAKTRDLVASAQHVYRHAIRGLQDNKDTLTPIRSFGG